MDKSFFSRTAAASLLVGLAMHSLGTADPFSQ